MFNWSSLILVQAHNARNIIRTTPTLYTTLSLLKETNPEIKKQLETQFSEYLTQDLTIAVPKSCLIYSNGTYHLSMRNDYFEIYEIWKIEPRTKEKILKQLGDMLQFQDTPLVLIPITSETKINLMELKKKHDLNWSLCINNKRKINNYNNSYIFKGISEEEKNQLTQQLKEIELYSKSNCEIELSISLLDSDFIELSFSDEVCEYFKNTNTLHQNDYDNKKILESCQIDKLHRRGKIKSLSEKQKDMSFNFK